MRNVWSSQASTIPALCSILSVGDEYDRRRLHMIALAQAAGYKVWWISNQADTAIENLHARLADEVHMLSHTPGRSAKSLDHGVLAPMHTALADASRAS